MIVLRDLREQHYISRRELAELAGVSESTITRMEEGNRVTKENAEKVLETLSKQINQTITINDIEGLNLYNVMRDRRNNRKGRNTTGTQGNKEPAVV